jgi:murein DD-endopeptidase MepM/ murein hydrolase activator NlpD
MDREARRTHRRPLAALVVLLAALLAVGAPPARAVDGTPPVDGPVARGFDPPSERWQAGHRGVDLRAEVGALVVAAVGGTVSFAGTVAGKPVVVVDHGDGLRTTYEPVLARVAVGTRVGAGTTIGVLAAGHDCPGGTCLHWGLKRGDTYLDPLSLLGAEALRLLPATAVGTAGERASARRRLLGAGAGIPGLFLRPVPGRISSGFGRRLHPIFHEWRAHEGVDFTAGCGTPIRAAAAGRVVHAGYDASGGWRLVIDHGIVGGRRLTTSYLHAQGYRVRSGERVAAGDVVGRVGTTGWSTGCHLHFSVQVDGRQVDPAGFL